MYLTDHANRRLLQDLRRAAAHPLSRVWLDAVSSEVIAKTTPFREVKEFLAGIERIGEPFIWGFDKDCTAFTVSGFSIESNLPSDHYRPSSDPVFDLYRFFVLAAGPGGVGE